MLPQIVLGNPSLQAGGPFSERGEQKSGQLASFPHLLALHLQLTALVAVAEMLRSASGTCPGVAVSHGLWHLGPTQMGAD